MRVQRLGAIERWRWELRHGVTGQVTRNSSTWRRSPLFFAACHELAAVEAERQGLHLLASQYAQLAADALGRPTIEPGTVG